MAMVAVLDVVLGVRTAGIVAGMSTAAKSVENLGARIQRVGALVFTVAKGMNAAFGTIAGATTAAAGGAALFALGSALKPLGVVLSSLSTILTTTLKVGIEVAGAAAKGLATILGTTLRAGANIAMSVLRPLGNLAGSIFGNLGGGVMDSLKGIGKAVSETFSSVFGGIKDSLGGVASSFKSLVPVMAAFGNIGGAIFSGFASVLTSVLGAAVNFVGTALAGIGQIIGTVLVGAIQSAVAVVSGLAGAFISLGAAILQTSIAQFTTISATGRLADRLHVTTQELFALDLAARKSGAEAGEFAIALDKIRENIAIAVTQGGPALQALNELRLDPEQLNAMGTVGALKMISEALSRVGNSFQQVRLARDLAGRGGTGFMNTLLLGAKGFEEAMNKAASFDKLNRAEVQVVQNARAAIKDIEMAWESLKDRVAFALAPAIQRLADAFTALLKNVDGKLFELWGDMVLKAVLGAEFVVKNFGKVWEAVLATIEAGLFIFAGRFKNLMGVIAESAIIAFDTIKYAMSVGADRNVAMDLLQQNLKNLAMRIELAFTAPLTAVEKELSDKAKGLFDSVTTDISAMIDSQFNKIKSKGGEVFGDLKKMGAFLWNRINRPNIPIQQLQQTTLAPFAQQGSKEAFEIIAKAQAAQTAKIDPVPGILEKGNAILDEIKKNGEKVFKLFKDGAIVLKEAGGL